MKNTLLYIGVACIGVSAYELYKRQRKLAQDENATDIAVFLSIGVILIATSKGMKQ